MRIGGTLRRGRRWAERLMTTQVVVTRPGDLTDPVTGEAEQVEVYRGKAKLTSYEGHERSALAGQHALTEQRMSLHFPVGSFYPQVGDNALVTDSTDTFLVGRRFRIVQSVPFKEHASAYRCFVDEVTR